MMSPSMSMVYKNPFSVRGSEKLYLDFRTADVFFVFGPGTDDTVKIPAHKCILSALSEVFDVMFFGPDRIDSEEISIRNTTPDVFTEFLQFFYLHKATLTIENKSNVMELCEQYRIDDCKNAYSEMFKPMLNTENMCWAYEISIEFKRDSLKKMCEEKISKDIVDIIESYSFYECRLSLLQRILKLDTLECAETVLFDCCIAWAKNACINNGLDIGNTKNLRAQLGYAICDIRFGEMTIEEFYVRYYLYEGFFTSEEFADIVSLIASKDIRQTKFNQKPRIKPKQTIKTNDVLICERMDSIASSTSQQYRISQRDYTVFTSNHVLWLTKIECSEIFNNLDLTTPTKVKIVQLQIDNNTEKILYLRQLALSPLHETTIDLPTPLEIKPSIKYGIILEISQPGYNLIAHKLKVEIADGIFIKFHNHANGSHNIGNQKYGIVSRMHFQPSPLKTK